VTDRKTDHDILRDQVICDVEYQLAFWTNHFGVSSGVLLDVIRRVGPKIRYSFVAS
jgi:hypothetical protein